MKTIKTIAAALICLLTIVYFGQGCSGAFQVNELSSLSPNPTPNNPTPGNPDNFYKTSAFGHTEMRRLTRFEVKNTIKDIFNLDIGSDVDLLPNDIGANTHFDNAYEGQTISPLVVSSYIQFAETIAARLVNQNNFVSQNAGCVPQSASDQNCLESFIYKTGRLLLRRPLSSSETQTIAERFINIASEENDFDTGVELSLQYLLANPEFLYRIEGSSGTSLTKISDYEVASRMAFMIWGAAPDDALLTAAQNGDLGTELGRVSQAQRMLNNTKSKRQWQKFHAMWLGYSNAVLPSTYQNDLNLETNKLLDKVIFETDQEWLNIFSLEETYVTPKLAAFYNMTTIPSNTGWVNYSGGRGGGILAHGTFLSLGAKFNDTSPTMRGYEIYKRVACGEIGAVPPGVDPDAPPGQAGDCKNKRYHMRTTVGCTSCHSITDNIGFGLENFGVFGTWRDTEPSLPSCTIDSKGDWLGKNFSGPKMLGEILSKDNTVIDCSSKQLFRFLMGRLETPTDTPTISALNEIRKDVPNLRLIIEEFIRSPAIQHKQGK